MRLSLFVVIVAGMVVIPYILDIKLPKSKSVVRFSVPVIAFLISCIVSEIQDMMAHPENSIYGDMAKIVMLLIPIAIFIVADWKAVKYDRENSISIK